MRLFRKIFTKLFHLPSPVELGKSKYNALPMDFFSEPGDYTWECWHKEVKIKYPVKYFFAETLTHWWAVHISMNVEHFWYWIKSHTYKKYHLLDLRQPHTSTQDDYKWGWRDRDSQILYACFNLLVSYVEIEMGGVDRLLKHIEALKELPNESDDVWVKAYTEIYQLYVYWTTERKASLIEMEYLAEDWHELKKAGKKEMSEVKFQQLSQSEVYFKSIEDDKLTQLIKLRGYMWT